MNIKKTTLNSLLTFLIYCLLFLIVIFLFNNLEVYRDGFKYTNFDSSMFYDLALNQQAIDIKGTDFNFLAYKAYPNFLIYYVSFCKIFNIEITYKILLFSNLLLVIITLLLYVKFLNPYNFFTTVIIILILLEPSFFGFSLTLERELFCSVILGMISYAFVTHNGLKKLLILTFCIYILFNLRLELLFIVILAFLGYLFFEQLNSLRNNLLKFVFISFTLVFVLFFSYFFYSNYGDLYINFMSLQLNDASKLGIGGKILFMPFPIRLIIYSVLYFFLPFPIFSFLNQPILFPYEIFLSISSITYLFFWFFILYNYKFINGKISFVLFICIIGHIVLGGTLFNYRHRIDLIVPLSLIFLHILNKKLYHNSTKKSILKESSLLFASATALVFIFNIILMLIKY